MERGYEAVTDVWTYRDPDTLGADLTPGVDLTGFSVEAVDGGIGEVDEATYDTSHSYIVVDTGRWIFGKKVMLPAGVINRIDLGTETVWVDRTKDQIKDAPELDEDLYRDEAYKSELSDYYAGEQGATPESRF